jgi:hypothetical protein
MTKRWLNCYYQKQTPNLSRTLNWKYMKGKKRAIEEPPTETEGKP